LHHALVGLGRLDDSSVGPDSVNALFRRVVLLGGREVTPRVERRSIEELGGSSGGERRRIFQVRLEDGRRCRLAQEPDGSWTLAHTADGR